MDDRLNPAISDGSNSGGGGRGEDGGGGDGGREKGEGIGPDLMDLLQEAHQRYESRYPRKVAEAKEPVAAGQSSDTAHIPNILEPLSDGKPSVEGRGGGAAGGGVLQKLFKSARLNQHLQQMASGGLPGVRTTDPQGPVQVPDPPAIVITSPLHSPQKTKVKNSPGITDPYSLLASGGITVQEAELRQRHPHRYLETETATLPQQGESTAQPHEKAEEEGSPGTCQFLPIGPSESSEQGSIASQEPEDSPSTAFRLMTPSDFERPSLSSRQKEKGGRGKGVGHQPDVLLTPQDFASPLHLASSYSRLHHSEPPSPSSVEMHPLTRSQFQQAVIHMIRTDEDFVDKMHEAYISSFMDRKSRTGKR